jgi:hypothetical protein
MSSIWSGLVRGAAAGAAGTTALNATTYLDGSVRGRRHREPPLQVVAARADAAAVTVLGRGRPGFCPCSGRSTGR